MTQFHVPGEWNYQAHRCENLKIRIMIFYSHLFSEKNSLLKFLAIFCEHVFDMPLCLSSLIKLRGARFEYRPRYRLSWLRFDRPSTKRQVCFIGCGKNTSDYPHDYITNHSATLTEIFPCFFLSCKANVRVKPAKMGHGPHSSKIF
jgi:hypothetical protein